MSLSSVLTPVLSLVFLAAAFALGFALLATRRIAADAERRVPPAGNAVTVAGSRLHYIEAGSGEPILLLHGLGGQLHHFRQTLVDDLSRDFRVIAIDRPGSGYSTLAPGATGRLPEQAAIVAGFAETLGLKRPLVVGHSLGGTVALAMALDRPDTVSGLVLLAPLTRLPQGLAQTFRGLYIRSPLLRRLMAHTIAVPLALKYAAPTLAFIFAPSAVPRGYMVGGGGLLGLRPSHFFATSTDLVAIEHDLPDMERRYDTIALPVGVVFGTADRVISHANNALPLEGRIDGLELDLVEGAGHMLPYDSAARCAAMIRKIAAAAFDAVQ